MHNFFPNALCFYAFLFVPEVTCTEPHVRNAFIVNGKASYYKYNTHIQYKCHIGYIMEGSGHLTCKENGWSSPPPKCNGKINQLYSMTDRALYLQKSLALCTVILNITVLKSVIYKISWDLTSHVCFINHTLQFFKKS